VGDDKLEAKFVLGLPIRADDEVGESGTGEWIFDPTHLVKDPPTSMVLTSFKIPNLQTPIHTHNNNSSNSTQASSRSFKQLCQTSTVEPSSQTIYPLNSRRVGNTLETECGQILLQKYNSGTVRWSIGRSVCLSVCQISSNSPPKKTQYNPPQNLKLRN